jgi:hypothetical protein
LVIEFSQETRVQIFCENLLLENHLDRIAVADNDDLVARHQQVKALWHGPLQRTGHGRFPDAPKRLSAA